jgi:hypothetical protein
MKYAKKIDIFPPLILRTFRKKSCTVKIYKSKKHIYFSSIKNHNLQPNELPPN